MSFVVWCRHGVTRNVSSNRSYVRTGMRLWGIDLLFSMASTLKSCINLLNHIFFSSILKFPFAVFHKQNNPKTLNNCTTHWRDVNPSQPHFHSIKTNQRIRSIDQMVCVANVEQLWLSGWSEILMTESITCRYLDPTIYF